MEKPILTIGMAHHDDFHGAYFTIQALRMYHREVMDKVEILVVENNPASAHGVNLKNLVSGSLGNNTTFPATKHVTYGNSFGTSQTRNAIFENASGKYVLVMDCHVFLPAGSLKRLIDFYESNPETNDIYSGPCIQDQLYPLYNRANAIWTHFNDQWRGQMWGTWGVSWRCECGQLFTVTDVDSEVEYRSLVSQKKISECENCKKKFPELPWPSHEARLNTEGFRIHGANQDQEPFEIPGQGLGLFSCRKDAWLGFNEHARGFGGEELYIHEKFRQAGAKAMCLPFIPWMHRFSRPDGVPYPLSLWNKVRNYVLEFNELGLSLDPIEEHFVASGLMSEKDWKHLVSDPVANDEAPAGCGGCAKKQNAKEQAKQFESVDEIFDFVHNSPRDLDQHMPKIKELASQVDHVTEFSERRESSIAIFAASPKEFLSHNSETGVIVNRCIELTHDDVHYKRDRHTPNSLTEIDETDMLFLDWGHNFKDVYSQLNRYAKSVRRYIVFHDTEIYGDKGPDGGPGMTHAIRQFVRENPKWSVVHHTQMQYGLTVLSCQKDDKPKLPGKLKMASNLAKALATHVSTGMEHTSSEEYEARLAACDLCPHRNDSQCSVCGCYIEKKAAMRDQDCPLALWPALSEWKGKGDRPE